jgi:hypothetical protein
MGKSGLTNLLQLIKNLYSDVKVYFWSFIQNSHIRQILMKISYKSQK